MMVANLLWAKIRHCSDWILNLLLVVIFKQLKIMALAWAFVRPKAHGNTHSCFRIKCKSQHFNCMALQTYTIWNIINM